jgi:hypothetical protein
MKNLKLLTGTAVLAGLLLTTGCVKNEEADGVKALRQAQASLIQAKATNETTLANAEAAYQNALAAVEQAKVGVQDGLAAQADAQAEALSIQNMLDSAQNEERIAELEYELAEAELQSELAQTQMRSQIDLLLVTAQKNLEEAQKELTIALSDYAAELAADAAKNKNLDEFIISYQDAMMSVLGYREDIIDKEKQIADAQLETDGGDLLAVISLDIAKMERELAMMNDWKARYEAANSNPGDLGNDSVEAAGIVADLETQIAAKELELSEATKDESDALTVRNEAFDDRDDALSEYNDALGDSTIISDFTYDDAGDPDIIPGSYLQVILNEPNASSDSYYSIEYYDDAIAGETDPVIIAELEFDKSVVVEYIQAIQSEYGGDIYSAIDDLKTAYFAAQVVSGNAADAYLAAGEDKDAIDAELDLLDYEKDYADDYLGIVADNYTNLVSALDAINEDIVKKEGDIGKWNNEVNSWVDYIALLQEELDELNTLLAVAEQDAANYQALIDEELGN